jgi:hypothetical protein
MRVGDADAAFWLEGKDGRGYCCVVESSRKTPKDEAIYRWRVELWQANEDDTDAEHVTSTRWWRCVAWELAVVYARNKAERMEYDALNPKRKP